MSFGVFVSFTLSTMSFFAAFFLIPSDNIPAFCTGKNGRSLNLSCNSTGASISHSMKNPYLPNVLSDCTHPFGSRLILSITSCHSGTPTNSYGIIRCMDYFTSLKSESLFLGGRLDTHGHLWLNVAGMNYENCLP